MLLYTCYKKFTESDIYSLGLILYQLVFDSLPAADTNMTQHFASISKALQEILIGCLQIDLSKRPTITDLLEVRGVFSI